MTHSPEGPVPVVGIGASAGGVEALQSFFEALPDQVGAAFVVVVHLAPEYRSEMAAILARKTAMPVQGVAGSLPLEADHVYVIPPDQGLQLSDSQVGAQPFREPRGRRAPVDMFFRSLAEQHGDGFAVILSGSGSDGAVGAKAIKEHGGLILVQDPTQAAFDGMPRAAIAAGAADFVLPVAELAGRLTGLVRRRQQSQESLEASVQMIKEERTSLEDILAHLRARTGHDFSQYKKTTVLRRIGRRMQVQGRETLGEYLTFLREHPEESQALFDELLIPVTNFFRDPAVWEALAARVLPALFEGEEPRTLRVWVPGCATGEEAYSLAMLFLEEAEQRGRAPAHFGDSIRFTREGDAGVRG